MMMNERKEQAVEAYTQYIRAHGGRVTPERMAVLEQMIELERFTVDELYERMKMLNFTVSRSSLYNIAHHLTDAGMMSQLQVGRLVKYQFCDQRSPRLHMICQKCGKVIDFNDAPLDRVLLQQRRKRFAVLDYSLSLFGICYACQAKKKKKDNNKKIK